jgi:hypothetical protein
MRGRFALSADRGAPFGLCLYEPPGPRCIDQETFALSCPLPALQKGLGRQPLRCRFTNSHTLEITTEPSPTEEATRLTDPDRTSPTAKIPEHDVA